MNTHRRLLTLLNRPKKSRACLNRHAQNLQDRPTSMLFGPGKRPIDGIKTEEQGIPNHSSLSRQNNYSRTSQLRRRKPLKDATVLKYRRSLISSHAHGCLVAAILASSSRSNDGGVGGSSEVRDSSWRMESCSAIIREGIEAERRKARDGRVLFVLFTLYNFARVTSP